MKDLTALRIDLEDAIRALPEDPERVAVQAAFNAFSGEVKEMVVQAQKCRAALERAMDHRKSFVAELRRRADEYEASK